MISVCSDLSATIWNTCGLCLQRCREVSFSLNPLKCAFAVRSGKLLGHIISQEGIVVDPDKVKAIMQVQPPAEPKGCMQFLGQIRWHGRHMRFLADIAIPLNEAAHSGRKEFQWTPQCDLAFRLV